MIVLHLYVQTNEVIILEQRNDIKELDCKLNSCLFFSSTKLARAFGKIADEAFRSVCLSPSHALLLYLVNQNGHMHQKEIGERLYLTPSTITRFVDKLESKKLVTRKTEGKNVYICSTKEGLKLQSDIIKAWNSLQDTYQDILTEEETHQFITISCKLLSKLEEQVD